MKRFFTLILSVLILCPFVALADIPDFSKLTDNELLASFYMLQAEAENRGITLPYSQEESVFGESSESSALLNEPLSLREGKYIIGEAIPAGSYIITCDKTEGDELSDMTDAYSSMFSSFGSEGEAFGSIFDGYGDLFQSLDDGMEVLILGDYGAEISSFYMKKGETQTLVLSEGTALEIKDGACTIIPN